MSSTNLKELPWCVVDEWESDFWKEVVKPPDGCWEWQNRTDHGGYGKFYIRGYGDFFAHRLAYLVAYGPFPKNMLVCHDCDNRRCCRPDHLFLGTNEDNNRDKVKKGRGNYEKFSGERHYRAKLTEDDVLSIYKRVKIGESKKALAREYGVYDYTINSIVYGKTWKHLGLKPLPRVGVGRRTDLCAVREHCDRRLGEDSE